MHKPTSRRIACMGALQLLLLAGCSSGPPPWLQETDAADDAATVDAFDDDVHAADVVSDRYVNGDADGAADSEKGDAAQSDTRLDGDSWGDTSGFPDDPFRDIFADDVVGMDGSMPEAAEDASTSQDILIPDSAIPDASGRDSNSPDSAADTSGGPFDDICGYDDGPLDSGFTDNGTEPDVQGNADVIPDVSPDNMAQDVDTPRDGGDSGDIGETQDIGDTSDVDETICEPGWMESNILAGVCVPQFVQISSYLDFTCGVTTQNKAYCWGDNALGQLGDGTKTNRAQPTEVAGLTDVAMIATGASHACALKTDGSVVCWGNGTGGALGNGGTADSLVPVQATGLTGGVTEISAGLSHSCAIKGSELYCWGLNTWGQVGVNDIDYMIPIPRKVALDNVVSVDCGTRHTCATAGDGRTVCWGYNSYGELGNGTTTYQRMPGVPVMDSSYTIWTGCGGWHSCLLNRTPGEDGGFKMDLFCWGRDSGQILGLAQSVCDLDGQKCALEAILVASWEGGSRSEDSFPALGRSHTCYIDGVGAVFCVGYNAYGQLGDGTTVKRTAFVTAVTHGIIQLAAGQNHSCALRNDGRVLCWGNGEYGQTGTDPYVSRKLPSPVLW